MPGSIWSLFLPVLFCSFRQFLFTFPTQCLGMKSFMAFLSSVAINEGSPPDVVQPEAHPILEKRSNSPKTKVDNAAATKINNNNNNNDSTGLSGAPSTPKGTSPRSARTTNGRAQNVTGEAKPSPTTPASLKAEVRTPPQRESQTSSARLSTIVNEKEQVNVIRDFCRGHRDLLVTVSAGPSVGRSVCHTLLFFCIFGHFKGKKVCIWACPCPLSIDKKIPVFLPKSLLLLPNSLLLLPNSLLITAPAQLSATGVVYTALLIIVGLVMKEKKRTCQLSHFLFVSFSRHLWKKRGILIASLCEEAKTASIWTRALPETARKLIQRRRTLATSPWWDVP